MSLTTYPIDRAPLATRPDSEPGDPLPTTFAPAPAKPRGGVRSGRLEAVDVARGLAMLGMISVHVQFESTAWWTTAAQGRAAVLFMTLAGLTISVLRLRGAASASDENLRRRGAILFLFGLAMSLTFWWSSILHYYGVLFLLAPLLLPRSNRALVGLAALAIGLGPVALVSTTTWRNAIDPTSSAVVTTSLADVAFNMFAGLYSLVVWIGFFCVGILISRIGIDRRRWALTLAAIGFALTTAATVTHGLSPLQGDMHGAGSVSATALSSTESIAASATDVAGTSGSSIGSTSITSGAKPEVKVYTRDWASLWAIDPHSNRSLWALQALGISLAVIGLLSAAPRVVLRLLSPVAALGTVSLTAYIVHAFLVQDVWFWVGALDHPERQVPALLGIFVVMMTGAVVIRRRWQQGPFEWLLKWISGRPTSTSAASSAAPSVEAAQVGRTATLGRR